MNTNNLGQDSLLESSRLTVVTSNQGTERKSDVTNTNAISLLNPSF
jgi:hypothetical protein